MLGRHGADNSCNIPLIFINRVNHFIKGAVMKTNFISYKVIAAGIACVLLMLACSVFSTPHLPSLSASH